MQGETNLKKVMKDDGVDSVNLADFENKPVVSIKEIENKMGKAPWAVRVAINDRFGAVLITQNSGEGNRLHYHPDTDEFWFIVKGEWEWFIEGEGTKKVIENDIVLVKQGKKHRIMVTGKEQGIRLAITKPNVGHVFVESLDKETIHEV